VAQHVAGFPVQRQVLRLAEWMSGELAKESGVAKGRRTSVGLVEHVVEPHLDGPGSRLVVFRRAEESESGYRSLEINCRAAGEHTFLKTARQH